MSTTLKYRNLALASALALAGLALTALPAQAGEGTGPFCTVDGTVDGRHAFSGGWLVSGCVPDEEGIGRPVSASVETGSAAAMRMPGWVGPAQVLGCDEPAPEGATILQMPGQPADELPQKISVVDYSDGLVIEQTQQCEPNIVRAVLPANHLDLGWWATEGVVEVRALPAPMDVGYTYGPTGLRTLGSDGAVADVEAQGLIVFGASVQDDWWWLPFLPVAVVVVGFLVWVFVSRRRAARAVHAQTTTLLTRTPTVRSPLGAASHSGDTRPAKVRQIARRKK